MKSAIDNLSITCAKSHCYSLMCFFIIILICFIKITYSDEICDLVFNRSPEDFEGKTIVVPDEIVALSNRVLSGIKERVIEGIDSGGPSSIVFIIDHSYSMMGLGDKGKGNDNLGARFRVVHDLLDTLYNLNPNNEIGLVVFREVLYFDHRNNDLFVRLPINNNNGSTTGPFLPFIPRPFNNNQSNNNQSYLPLIKLNSELANGKKGIEAIKELLKTETVKGKNYFTGVNAEYVDLKYKPQFNTQGNTNINVAFDAANEAMKLSSYSKSNRFIIFLSDGEPYPTFSVMGGRDPFEFVKGNNTATTFTIFFNKENKAPQSLKNMTENISKNGYSESNQSSNIWAVQADYHNLMKFFKKNVFNNLLTIYKSSPNSMNINGKNASKYTNDVFMFQDRFPFKKSATEFDFNITYRVENQTTKEVKDTSKKFTIIFERSADVNMPDGFEKKCWDRSLGFYFNDKKINSADDKMTDLEIRFQFDPGEAGYSYSNVNVDIMNKKNVTNDMETFTLDKKESYFTKSFKRIIEPKPSKNGILEHLDMDSIIAIYRNPDIPLDTLRISIPFTISKFIFVKKGTYFDTDADGYVDSIFINTDGDFLIKDLPDFMNALKLPSHRKLVIKDSFVSDDGVGLVVEEDKSSAPATYVTEEDIFTVDQMNLTHGGVLLEHSSQFIDEMAPVIIKAELLKDFESNDTLNIVFSEPVKKVHQINPFYFKNKKTGTTYVAFVNQFHLNKNTNSNIAHFHIRKIEGIDDHHIEDINPRDNIWIKTDNDNNNVVDLLGNNQDNPDNVRRNLNIKYKYKPIKFILSSTTPYEQEKRNSIPSFISSLPEVSSYIRKKNFVKKDGLFQGMIISVRPDNPLIVDKNDIFTATLSIYDAVSNTILRNESMGFYDGGGNIKNWGLFFAWDGTNIYNRYVSNGVYVIIARINHLNKDSVPLGSVVKRSFIGIKD